LSGTCDSSTLLNRPIWKNYFFLYLKYSDLQVLFLKKLSKFSQGINALDVAASNIDGFLWRGTCVSSP
jgi:hypothetical protein